MKKRTGGVVAGGFLGLGALMAAAVSTAGGGQGTGWGVGSGVGIRSLVAAAGAAASVTAVGSGVVAAEVEPTIRGEELSSLRFRSIGPVNMGGRIVDISVYEKDPSIWYVASASGGLLKTTNKGTTFEHQFDNEATVSIGDVEVFQGDPDIVWVGTGEQNPRNSVSMGDGVYKSTDGGKTWKNMGLRETYSTGDIITHPTDPDTVWVAAMGRVWGENKERGVYKTTDGGETWEQTLFIDERTGVIELAMHPEDPDVLLASAWERQRDEFDTNDPAKRWGPGSGLYRSEDGGETWEPVTEGLPTVDMGRMGIEWSGTDADRVYMLVDTVRIGEGIGNPGFLGVTGRDADAGAAVVRVAEESPAAGAGIRAGDVIISINGERVISNDGLQSALAVLEAGDRVEMEVVRRGEVMKMGAELVKPERPNRTPFTADLGGQAANIEDRQGEDGFETGGLFVSEDAGRSWERLDSINPRPMYFSKVGVDPSDDNFMWVAGVPLARSVDGGKTWTRDGTPGEVHVDHHAIWINPSDGRHILLGNDGGLYESFDRGATWRHHNTNVICQFYHVGVDNRPFYNVYGGLQDNGSWGGPNRSRDGQGLAVNDWFRIGGGDGFICFAAEDDPDQLYYSSQNGGVGRVNLRTGERAGLRPRAPRGMQYAFNWKTPFMLSHHNPKIYYLAGNYVFRSFDKGDDAKRISPQITRTRRGTATAFDESPVDSNILYVGSDDGALWVTRDGAATWENIVFPYDAEAFPSRGPAEGGDPTESGGEEGGEAERPQRRARGGGGAGARAGAGAGAAVGSTERAGPARERGGAADAAAGPADPIAGEWEGVISADGSTFTLTIKRDAEGGYTARVESDAVDADSASVRFTERTGRLRITFESEVVGQIQLRAALEDGVVKGTVEAAAAEFSAEFTAKRREERRAAPPSRPQREERAERAEREERRERAGQPERAAARAQGGGASGAESGAGVGAGSFDAGDPIVGEFAGQTTGENAGQAISVTFTREGGRLRAFMTAAFFEGEATVSGYNESSGEVRFELTPNVGRVVVTGRLEGDAFNGSFEVPDFGFTGEFALRRGGSAAGGDGVALSELLAGPRRVSSIEASRFEANRVYITLAGYFNDDDAPHVYASEDAGRTWRSLAGNLPEGSPRAIREDMSNPEVLYLGTEFAFWVSVDRGRSWAKVSNNTNLPTVAVHDIAQHEWSGDLVLATHGRGMWVANAAPLRQMTAEAVAARAWLFEPARVVRWRQDAPRGRGANEWWSGDEPSGNAEIYYRLSEAVTGLEIEVQDLSGAVLARFSPDGSKTGLQRLDWNMRRQGTGQQRFGPLVETGTYRVVMRAGEVTIQRKLEIIADPELGGADFAVDEFEAELYADEETPAAEDGGMR